MAWRNNALGWGGASKREARSACMVDPDDAVM